MLRGFSFSTGSSASLIGLILPTVSLIPVPTASIFLVLDLIYSDLAAKNLNKINKVPFSCVSELFHLIPLVFDFVHILLTLIIFFFEVVNDV